MQSLIAAWILPDQLLEPSNHPVLQESLRESGGDQKAVRVLLIESRRHFTALPYHKKRLTLYISAMRHYAGELRSAGWQVDYLREETFADGLQRHCQANRWQRCVAMEALEHPTAQLQKQMAEKAKEFEFNLIVNSQFYWQQTEYVRAVSKNVIMENFYRAMRRQFQLLMDKDGEPEGGQWNFDSENRKPLPKKLQLPKELQFEPDEVT